MSFHSLRIGLAKFWTKRGRKQLGQLVKQAREKLGWSQRHVSDLTRQISPMYGVSDGAISTLESGAKEPKHNTVVAIAAVGFVINPLTGQPFTEDELFDIAAERLDPQTGKYKLGTEELTIAALIDLEIKNQPRAPKRLALEKLATKAQLDPDRLEAIYVGQTPTDEELAKLSQALTKDDGTFWRDVELQSIRDKGLAVDTSVFSS